MIFPADLHAAQKPFSAETSNETNIVLNRDHRKLVVGFVSRPLYIFSEGEQLKGLDFELAENMFRESGIEVEYRQYPWQRILYLLKTGEIDVALSAGKTRERQEFLHYSSYIFRTGHNGVFVRKADLAHFTNIKNLRDLYKSDAKIAVLRGVSYSDTFEHMQSSQGFKNTLLVLDNESRLANALIRGRVDAYLASEYGEAWRLSQSGNSQITYLKNITTEEEAQTWVVFSKESVPLSTVSRVSEALIEIKNNGIYQNTLDKYLGKS